jgi:hypothetical protein
VSVQVVSSYVTPWLSNTCLISVISFVITLYNTNSFPIAWSSVITYYKAKLECKGTDGQEILHLLLNPKVHYCIHKSLPIASNHNLVHSPSVYSFTINCKTFQTISLKIKNKKKIKGKLTKMNSSKGSLLCNSSSYQYLKNYT